MLRVIDLEIEDDAQEQNFRAIQVRPRKPGERIRNRADRERAMSIFSL